MKSKLFKHMSLPEMYFLDVDESNKIYFEVSGKKDGIPVIFIHGGPGGHCRSEHHNLFDPNIFKSIIFDQRGCGKSLPYRSLSGNNTNNLVEDIEKIRDFLKIKNFIIVGGSWGATLALKYAITYPKNISAILLRSVFLGTMNEIDWAFIDGPKIFAPELFKKFQGFVKNSKHLINSYYKEICKKNSKLHSWVWHDYERILSQINPESSVFDDSKKMLNREGLPNSPFMELHYIKNHFFMNNNEILQNSNALKNIPGYIVQGRYDLICPPVNAFNLSEKWTTSKLLFINTAGHSSSDEGIIDNLQNCLIDLVKSI
jgi:proline iminopeptidase